MYLVLVSRTWVLLISLDSTSKYLNMVLFLFNMEYFVSICSVLGWVAFDEMCFKWTFIIAVKEILF